MKFPESWLREHVAVDADRDTLAATLTAIGLEVEGVENIGAALPGVVVAQIVSCEKHPEADRLRLCQVSIGGQQTVQIVCGAPNAREGLKAPLATVGAELPGGLAIKAAKLRGVESFGMLCSAKELGIDADASGLLELSEDAPVGVPVADYLGLPDASFELKLTPNRADCFSVRGVAYDVAAALGSSVNAFEIAAVPARVDDVVQVVLDAPADCPRYCGRVIRGVNPVAASPLWLRQRLQRAGLRPISLLVDITNYVMLELGQPMHAFDLATLKGAIHVRRARDGERLVLLDEREVTLDPNFLVIADQSRALAVAGVMGGFDSRATDATVDVFLESAFFAPEAIIGRSRTLGLHTDSSQRFERGVDPELPRHALERATALVLAIGGGEPGPVVEAVDAQRFVASPPVRLRAARLTRVLGMEVPGEEVERILRALGMGVSADADGWLVVPPSRRFDIAIEEDLIEEVARIHGYDRVPLHAPTGQIQLAPLPETQVPLTAFTTQLAARDYFEAINYAFLDGAVLQVWQQDAGAIALANPLSAELGVMRTALLPGLVEALRRNLARQQSRVRLFEAGRVFHSGEDGPVERLHLAAVACGPARAEQWSERTREVDFFDVRGDLDSLLALTAGGGPVRFAAAEVAWLHPGRSARLERDGMVLGHIGHLHPALLHALDLDQEVVAFELDVALLSRRSVPDAGELSRFPSVRRDLAVIVAETVAWDAIESSLVASLGGVLRRVLPFDVYQGKGMETGFKSVAMGLIFQDDSRTLEEQDIEQAVAAALDGLARDCGAVLRGM
ncbi:phenylalanine--tRNA ligase subunit beta [Xanthomonadaceae bacterium XH05]|nr:phenylalanine--tRNA ligase subunit beta [Xanthomonadaceae bacterium XH05]